MPTPLTLRAVALRGLVLLALVAGGAGLAGATASAAKPDPAKPAPAKADTILLEFALYYTPRPAADPEAELRRLLAEPARRLRAIDAPASAEALATVEPFWVPIDKYAPPSAESLRYTGVGVEPAEAPKLAAADRVFVVDFVTPRHGVLVTNRAACQVMADLAKATGGKIWDEETRQLYSPERWQADRLGSWQGPLPDMTKHVVMHQYANPELIRIITLGMRKFGLPDLVVAELPSQHTRAVGIFINAFMQRLVEGQRPQDSRLRLTFSEIRHLAVRSAALENPLEGAKGTVLVSTHPAPLEAGDPKNTLWRLDFPDSNLKGSTERTLWGMGELFGSKDVISQVASGDPEMAAARTRAREKFFAQEARFRTGLAFNEHLLVKGAFRQDDHTEYMWVEVSKWGPKHVEGLLTSDPYYIKTLHSGSKVTVPFDEIFDYILYKPDGTEEGNESGKILQAREKKR
ncbi:MAG: DUF2314 domain-containing protein [Verrucomicrobia bacterium]|nr:DUF2314 domain-containing protein [Verrucomicrobiota bacterium]